MGINIVHQGNVPNKLDINFLSDNGFCYSVNSFVLEHYIFSTQTKNNNLQLATEVIQRRAKINQQITRMLVIVVVAFYFVWIPYHVVYFLSAFSVKISCSYYWFCINLPFLYPVLNPVVYYIFNSNYRQGFRELLCCPWPCANKCKECLQPAVSPQGENSVENTGQVNNATENIELQEP